MDKITKLTCPQCGGDLSVETGKRTLHCKYCGSTFDYDDGSLTIRIIDESRLAELKLQERTVSGLIKYHKVILLIIIACIGLCVAGMTLVSQKHKEYEAQGLVSPGSYAYQFKGQNYKQVVQKLKDRGFKKIKKIAVGGGLAFWDWGEVVEVTINGKSGFSANSYYDPKVPVVVSYK